MRKTKRKIDKVTIISIALIALFYMSQILLWDGERSDSDLFQIICFTVGFLYGNFYIIKKIINSIRAHEKYTKSKTLIDNREKLFAYIEKNIKRDKKAVIYADPEMIPELTDRFLDRVVIRKEEEKMLERFLDSEDFDLIFLYPSDKLRLVYYVLAEDTQSILNSKKVTLLKEGEPFKKDLAYYSESVDCFYRNVWIVIRDIFYI